MLYLVIGFIVGLLAASGIFVFWLVRASGGELQIYEQDGQIFPVISVKTKKDFEKRYLLLTTKKY